MTNSHSHEEEDEIGIDVVELWYEDIKKMVMYDPKTRDIYDNISGKPIGKLPLNVVWWKRPGSQIAEQVKQLAELAELEEGEDSIEVDEVMWNNTLYYKDEKNGDLYDVETSENVGNMNTKGEVILF